MDLNRLSYYRANPFVSNDFIPLSSMVNRKRKQFPSQIPQGQQYLASRPGKRIFKQKVDLNEIKKDKILNSPERYPFQNRIALDKSYSRNLHTIDIEGASSGTKVSESIRNKHKALEELRRRNQDQSQNPLAGQSLDQVYQKKRRQLAQQIQKNIEIKKTNPNLQNKTISDVTLPETKNSSSSYRMAQQVSQGQLQAEYERYLAHNSNQKYTGMAPHAYQYEGFQRYRRPQGFFQTLDSYNNGRIPERISLQKPMDDKSHNKYHSIDAKAGQNIHSESIQNQAINRGSIEAVSQSNNIGESLNSKSTSYINNGYISINNRYRSNPEYIEKYPTELQKRMEQNQKNKQIQENLKAIYQNDRGEFRRHNPTNLSFNIAAKNSLMGPIV